MFRSKYLGSRDLLSSRRFVRTSGTLESCEGNGSSPPCDVTSCAARVSAAAHSVDHKVTEVVRTFLCQDMLCPGSSTAGPSHQGLPGRSRGGPRRPGCYRHRPAVRYKIRPGLNPGYRDISPQVSIRYYRGLIVKGREKADGSVTISDVLSDLSQLRPEGNEKQPQMVGPDALKGKDAQHIMGDLQGIDGMH
ncbi:hypothetical protein HPB52_015893 [Rhipicephalus sanguineus]|uniref:Uncharacterized protein n=1 Tax=Rhipicephalus sanguineus TaxID=34632 RepID=A0A9D4PEV3_RHISA|nr:hypothetical protein HPB52_015893 [Rhipicephalus sanguineus]